MIANANTDMHDLAAAHRAPAQIAPRATSYRTRRMVRDANNLTPREAELLLLLVTEKSTIEIAHQFAVCQATLKILSGRIYGKLGVMSRQILTVGYWRDGKWRVA